MVVYFLGWPLLARFSIQHQHPQSRGQAAIELLAQVAD